MLFHKLSKYTGLYQHGCTSDGLRGFPWHSQAERQVQGKNGMVHPSRGTRSPGTIPATNHSQDQAVTLCSH